MEGAEKTGDRSGAQPGTPALEVVGLVKRYGRTLAVKGVDLRVERGQVFGLLGPNGSGKTTTLSCALGLLHPTSGSCTVLGEPAKALHRTRGRVGCVFDVTVGFYGRQLEATYQITEFDPQCCVEWSIDGKGSGTTRIDVVAHGTGSTIDYRVDLEMKGFARMLDRGLAVALEGIGENAERGLRRQFGR